jgi:hypothetical protein
VRAVLSLSCMLCIAGCRTFQYREPYLHMLQTASAEVAVCGENAPTNSLLECLGTTLERGVIFHTQFEMLASNLVEELALGGLRSALSIDGVYRLRWRFVEGRDPQSTRRRPVSGVSNEFHLLYPAR